MRWRTQPEVVAGKGHFSCGARGCAEAQGLASYEVDFAYEEAGERKQVGVWEGNRDAGRRYVRGGVASRHPLCTV